MWILFHFYLFYSFWKIISFLYFYLSMKRLINVWIAKGFFAIYCQPDSLINLSAHFIYKCFPFSITCPGKKLLSGSSTKILSKNTIIYVSLNFTRGAIKARLQLYTYSAFKFMFKFLCLYILASNWWGGINDVSISDCFLPGRNFSIF